MRKAIKFNDILSLIETNPIDGARAARDFCDGTRLRGWQGSVAAFKLAQRLYDDTPMQAAFYNDAFWDGGSMRNFRKVLLHAHQYLYNDRFGRDSDRAQSHAEALQPFFDDGKTTPEQMLAKLQASGGWSGLKKAASPPPPLSRAGAKVGSEAKAEGRDGNARSVKGVVDKNDKAIPPVTPVMAAGAATSGGASRAAPKTTTPEPTVTQLPEPRPRNVRWSPKQIEKRLLVDLNPLQLRKFTGEASSVGDRAKLEIVRRDDDEHGMIIWQAIDVDYTAVLDNEA